MKPVRTNVWRVGVWDKAGGCLNFIICSRRKLQCCIRWLPTCDLELELDQIMIRSNTPVCIDTSITITCRFYSYETLLRVNDGLNGFENFAFGLSMEWWKVVALWSQPISEFLCFEKTSHMVVCVAKVLTCSLAL